MNSKLSSILSRFMFARWVTLASNVVVLVVASHMAVSFCFLGAGTGFSRTSSRVVDPTPTGFPGSSQHFCWLEPGTLIKELLDVINEYPCTLTIGHL